MADCNRWGDNPEAVKINFGLIDWPQTHWDFQLADLLKWMISDVLADPVLDLCRHGRIHVIKKPRCRQERYLLVGGLQEYLTLLMNSWEGDVIVMLWPDVSKDEAEAWFFRDLQRMLFGLRAGPIAEAVRAAFLVELAKASVSPSESEAKLKISKPSFGIKAPPRLLAKRHLGLLKEITGFDRRSYNRAKKKSGEPESMIQRIDGVLGLAAQQGDQLEGS